MPPVPEATGRRLRAQDILEIPRPHVFVSGHRFSDDVNSLKSHAPLGAGRRIPTFSAASSAVPPRTNRDAGFTECGKTRVETGLAPSGPTEKLWFERVLGKGTASQPAEK